MKKIGADDFDDALKKLGAVLERSNQIEDLLSAVISCAHRKFGARQRNALSGPVGEYLVVEPIKSDGSVRELRRNDAVREFSEAYKKVRPQLDQLMDAIGSDRSRR